MGHFLAARSLGMKVDEFSVGVGPRILGFRRKSTKNGGFTFERIIDGESEGGEEGIEFSLRAIPLGGYVRFPENYNRTLAFEVEDVARMARNEARILRIERSTLLEKVLENLASASFLLNVVTLGSLTRWQTKRVEEQLRQAEKEMAERGGRNRGNWFDTLPWMTNNNSKKTDGNGGLLKPMDKETLEILRSAASSPATDYFDDPDLLQNRPWQERAIVLSGGVVFNILLAFTCYLGELSGGRGLPNPVFDGGAVVSQNPNKDSPSYGLLKRGDVILGVNDVVTSQSRNSDESYEKQGVWSSQREISNVISTIRDTPDGESVKLTIIHGRDGSTLDKPYVISIKPKKNDNGQASIGVMLMPNYIRTDMVRGEGIMDAVTKAGKAVYDLTSETAKSIVGLLIGIISGKGLPAGTSMSGPIGVVKTGATVVGTQDVWAVVAFAASISINLAVVNSLPLPALDGGQLAFVLAEAVVGRRIDQRLQEGINAGALLILLFISFGTAVGDVTAMFR
jgi:membrane-associated protease RseP (regulator of RpoE activity)